MSEPAPRPAGAAGRAGMKKELPERFKSYRHVWVFMEYEHGQVHPVSLELLGEGRKLADKLQVELAGVLIGAGADGLEAATQTAFEHGADVAYIVDDPVLEHYRNQPYTAALTELTNTYQPEVMLLGATTLGRDLAGSVATTLKTGLTADSTELAIDDDRSLAATRPTFGGSLLCTIHTLNFRPQMATVRPRVFALPTPEPGRTGRIVRHAMAFNEADIVTKVLDFIKDRDSGTNGLAFADIVVAGGVGLRSAENFQLVRALAETLGAEWGGTRPCVQKGWIPADRQIGQTGKTIRPKLYIAAGISGAIQHRVGVEGADLIVALNNDPAAPILDFAHHAVLCDAIEFLPALTRAFRARLAVNRLAG